MYENVRARLVIMEKHFTRNSRKLNVNVIIYKKFNYNETTSYNAMPGQKWTNHFFWNLFIIM